MSAEGIPKMLCLISLFESIVPLKIVIRFSPKSSRNFISPSFSPHNFSGDFISAIKKSSGSAPII